MDSTPALAVPDCQLLLLQPRRRLEGGGGLKVAARTSSADRKREQERDLGSKEGWMGHGNLV